MKKIRRTYEYVNFKNYCESMQSSYAGGYVEMIIPILLLVAVSIISAIYYKKMGKRK